MSKTIVLDAITVQREDTFAFDVWYANRYLPQMLAHGCFASLRRYLSPIRGSYLAVLDLRDDVNPEAVAGRAPAHESIASHERLVADAIGGRTAHGADELRTLEADILYPVFFRVPADREHEFNAWYEEEHMDMLLRSPYWPMCRRYSIRNPGAGVTHVAMHYLTDLRALESPERDLARGTPWRDRLAAEPWFKARYRVYFQWGGRLGTAGGTL